MGPEHGDESTPIHVEEFWQEGRGPELRRMIWSRDGTVIRAIEYLNPDWKSESDLRHVTFERPQVVQITPEEAVSWGISGSRFGEHRPAGMFDLGRSTWLESFAPRHLAKCRHIQLLFYDQLVDVICEGVACGSGPAQVND